MKKIAAYILMAILSAVQIYAATTKSTSAGRYADTDNNSEKYNYIKPELPKDLWICPQRVKSKFSDLKSGNVLKYVNARKEFKKDFGLHLVWYSTDEYYLNLPLINGGQIFAQWADFSPQKGAYNFDLLDKILKRFHEKKIKTTIQINGNNKPAWLFEEIPFIKGEKIDAQVNDPQGTLMYWYPSYAIYYADLLKVFGKYLEKSQYKDAILAVRFNFDAIGTEKLIPPNFYKSKSGKVINAKLHTSYTYPDKADKSFKTDWNPQLRAEYEKKIFSQFIESVRTYAKIFVRNNIDAEIFEKNKSKFENGELAWFHTSSEVEPRGKSGEEKTRCFYEYSRTGKTESFAEAWSDCWGYQSHTKVPHFCNAIQWNYWRLLSDLASGVGNIAVRPSELNAAMTGAVPHSFKAESSDRNEMRRALEFAYKYAGYCDKPFVSPGAFVALRESHENQSAKMYPQKYGKASRALSVYTSDYTFLAMRQKDNSKGLILVGPETSRFGAFAREYAAGEKMKIVLNPKFAKAIYNKPLVLRVVYLDKGKASWRVKYGNNIFKVNNTDTKEWKTAEWKVKGAERLNDLKESDIINREDNIRIEKLAPDIILQIENESAIFHLIEVDRSFLF